jgi:hypothetical protein
LLGPAADAAPSETGEHIGRVIGHAIILAFSASSTEARFHLIVLIHCRTILLDGQLNPWLFRPSRKVTALGHGGKNCGKPNDIDKIQLLHWAQSDSWQLEMTLSF